jgi:hypothetical protein
MRQHPLKLSDFTEPFGPRYSCALTYTKADGWSGLCTGPRGFQCTITGATAEECCETAAKRVFEHRGSIEYELSYKYTDDAWAKACAEDAESPKARAEMLACPLCNEDHPEHEHAVRPRSAFWCSV